VPESRELAGWICDILDNIADTAVVERVRSQVVEITRRLPVYQQ
jgi:glycine hydroxymethyltransferase